MIRKSDTKKVCFIFFMLLCTLLTGCANGNDISGDVVYSAEYLKVPDGVTAVVVRLTDEGAVFLDIETEDIVFADYNGSIQNRVELNLREDEHFLDFTIDEENDCTYVYTTKGIYTIDRDGGLSFEPSDTMPETILGVSDETLSLVRDAISLADYDEDENRLLDVRFMENGDIICAFHDGSYFLRDIVRYTLIKPGTSSETSPAASSPGTSDTPDTDVETAPVEKATITIYALELDSWLLNEYIRPFNRSSAKYKIETETFLSDSTTRDAALQNLNSALIAGNMPDIIIYDNQTSVRDHASSGLLADLYTFMDGDPDFSKEDYLPGAFAASELSGRLYTVFPIFGILTMTARTSEVGDSPGWTLDEFLEYINRIDSPYVSMYLDSEGIWASSQEEFLVDMSYKLFVDPVTGEPSFDRDIFMKLLEIAKRFPRERADVTWTINITGKNPEDPFLWLDDAESIPAIIFMRRYFAEEITYKGYPGTGGNGSFFDPPARFAVTEQSGNKDGAWEFIKCVLDSSVNVSGNPVRIEHLEQLAEKSKSDVSISSGNEPGEAERRIVEGLVEKEIALIMDTVKSTDRILLYDRVITSIIEAEIKAYLAGHLTADEAADVIESKLEIYYAEGS